MQLFRNSLQAIVIFPECLRLSPHPTSGSGEGGIRLKPPGQTKPTAGRFRKGILINEQTHLGMGRMLEYLGHWGNSAKVVSIFRAM